MEASCVANPVVKEQSPLPDASEHLPINEASMSIHGLAGSSSVQAKVRNLPAQPTRALEMLPCFSANKSALKPLPAPRELPCPSCQKCGCSCDSTADAEWLAPAEDEPLSPAKKKRADCVYLLQPIYKKAAPTLLFDYPAQCMLDSRVNGRAMPLASTAPALRFRVSNGAIKYNCIVNTLMYAGFTRTTSNSYNINISNVPKPEMLRSMYSFQRVNHFPGIWQLGRKDCMWRNFFNQRRRFGSHYDFCPQTYIMPEDFNRLEFEREAQPKALWIRKPAASCCGIGIKVLSKNSHLSKKSGYVVSRYVDNPHIINGFKYDLRIYVCVTSFDPLRVYMYQDGLVRFATQAYTKDKKKIKKRFVHLTNFSVNKRSAAFVKNSNPAADGEGSKWSLRALREYFEAHGLDHRAVFAGIEDVVIKTLISAEPHVVNALNQGSKARNLCFEVYGFDILLDSALKPWLLEVNVMPSLSSSSPLDRRIKTSLMCDTFNLIGVVPFDRKALDKQLEQDKVARLLGIERQPKTTQRNLTVLQHCERLEDYALTEDDCQTLLDFEEEGYRSGYFRRIFPRRDNVEYYSAFFEITRYNNLLLRKYLSAPPGLLDAYCERNPDTQPV